MHHRHPHGTRLSGDAESDGRPKETYEVSEGCLSLDGERQTVRYQWIEVEYRDLKFKKQKQVFRDFPAEIVQHELDHCAGILI